MSNNHIKELETSVDSFVRKLIDGVELTVYERTQLIALISTLFDKIKHNEMDARDRCMQCQDTVPSV